MYNKFESVPATQFLAELSAKYPELAQNVSYTDNLLDLVDASDAHPFKESLIAYAYSTLEVQKLVKTAYKHDLLVIARTSRTGLSGGSVPTEFSLIIDLSRMTKIHELNIEQKTITADPGVTLGEIEDLLDPLGFMYPPDPASYRVASIGGTVATNAGGLRCVKYGVTADWVKTLEVVLAGGEVIELGHPVVKDATGYNLKQLFIGSEGTLGIITKVSFAFTKKPDNKILSLIAFANIIDAFATVIKIMQRVTPAICEVLDSGALKTRDTSAPTALLGEVSGWGADPALLMIEFDGQTAASEYETLQKIIAESFTDQPQPRMHLVQEAEREKVFEVRRGSTPGESSLRNVPGIAAGETIEALVQQTTNVLMLAQDISVPLQKLLATVQLVRDTAKKFQFESRIAAHAGDGNLHIVLVTDIKSGKDNIKNSSTEKLEAAMTEILQEIYSFGGATSGEHGIGLLKRRWAQTDLGPTVIDLHAQIKKALDPKGLMNPGKAF